jgi:hypothetical protein
MGMSAECFWFSPLGLFIDLFECHKQFLGIAKPKTEADINEIIPEGI